MSRNNVVGIESLRNNKANKTSSNGGGGDMETRIAKLESDVEYIKRDIGEIKTELKGHSDDFKAIRSELTEIKLQRSEMKIDMMKWGVYLVLGSIVVSGLMSKVLDVIF